MRFLDTLGRDGAPDGQGVGGKMLCRAHPATLLLVGTRRDSPGCCQEPFVRYRLL
jgi:hypothetical protein